MSDVKTDIYNQYKTLIYNYFYRNTLSVHASEDLTQDTFLKAFRFFESFRGESSIKTWLFKIARNTYLNYSFNRNHIPTENIEAVECFDYRDSYNNSGERMLIKKVLLGLSEEERTLIILRDINGFSYVEIASIMAFTEGKVKVSLHRARLKFQNLYRNECREDE